MGWVGRICPDVPRLRRGFPRAARCVVLRYSGPSWSHDGLVGSPIGWKVGAHGWVAS